MRISDWSSDVCSSDLAGRNRRNDCRAQRQMRRLTWTAPALADLREINAFLRREADGKTAVRTLSAIRQRANLLKEFPHAGPLVRSEEHTSELQSLMRISYAVFCLKKRPRQTRNT